jgi:hypothetical protein
MPTAKLNPDSARRHLQDFAFADLFIQDIGWNYPASNATQTYTIKETTFTAKPIADLSGFRVFEVTGSNGAIPDAATQDALWKQVTRHSAENLLIFLDATRHTSSWLWMRREPGTGKSKATKTRPRRHPYVKGQPGDLFLSKIAAMAVDLSELDAEGNIPITDAANRVRKALDIETVTKAFFQDFADQHGSFLQSIHGIPDEGDRRWYASVILNRLMFIWFLQKKTFLDGGDLDYLPNLLTKSKKAGKNHFFSEVLRDLFFEGFAKPTAKRHIIGPIPLGDIPYLNGGLFLPHGIEARMEGEGLFTGPFQKIKIKDDAFAGVFDLFGRYSWNLNDVPGADDREINPDVLGYIFEKYINQKEFGAYYTRPEITEYLCEQTVHQLVLDAANKFAAEHANFLNKVQQKDVAARSFDTISDVLLQAEGPLCRHLLKTTIPGLSLLDPACGSGAFLVAAMKTLLSLTTGLLGRAEAVQEREVLDWVEAEQKKHKGIPRAYWIKKKIITENIYGVDIMEEAVEIAKLRLFLALVASAEKRDQLEPLPNIEFNLLPGNSLIGLLHVDPTKFDSQSGAPKAGGNAQNRIVLNYQPKGQELGMDVDTTVAPTKKEKVGAYLATQRASKYGELLREKNRLVDLYKKAGDLVSGGDKQGEIKELTGLREKIEAANHAARAILNELLLKEFQGLGIRYEQATWDKAKSKEGKPDKRNLSIGDIEALQPFHWAYEFDEIIDKRGGFDAIITNPPWETFQPDAKEFFGKYDDEVTKKSMPVKEFEKKKISLLKDAQILKVWLEYYSFFGFQREYFRESPQYQNQFPIIEGRKYGKDVNLFKAFTEQAVHLIKKNGRTGIVIPSGIYTDLGATQLRIMLFETCRITGLFGFENRQRIFDNVDSRFKFVVLSFEKGGTTQEFPAAFMRHDASDLASFPNEDDLHLHVDLIKKLSPGSFSIMEFKSPLDIQIASKMLGFPMVGDDISGKWKIELHREFNMTDDAYLFEDRPAKTRLPLYEGKMMWHFDHKLSTAKYWIDEKSGRTALNLTAKEGAGYQKCRFAYRSIASNTNERTLISTVIPPCFTGNSLNVAENLDNKLNLLCTSLFNSFCVDWFIRMKVTTNINMFYIYQLPVPRLTEKDAAFRPLVERAARLIGTTAEFDGLLKEVFGPEANHQTQGVTDPQARQAMRAEIDAMVALLYDLTDEEFSHILGTFPIVDEAIKNQTLQTFRTLMPTADDRVVSELIKGGESQKVEFKDAATFNRFTGKKEANMMTKIVREVAGFLNSGGGNLFIGVEDSGTVVGIDEDVKAADPQKPNRDGYQLFLRNSLSDKLKAENTQGCVISFHEVEGKPICRILISAAPKPVYLDGSLLIRDGSSSRTLDAQQAASYIDRHW